MKVMRVPTADEDQDWVDNIEDLEWSDYGRSPRFVSGWYILPAFALSVAMIVWIVVKLVH